MLVKVVEASFTTDSPWLFRLSDAESREYFVLNSNEYALHGLSSPVTKKHIDSLDVGSTSRIEYTEIGGKYVVTAIK
ncbi:hypothetical protein JC525_19590 [Alteromonas sp. IB21]|uniref:hypothetical protein n=1 Tax=Alteromonas sp. IB21 TaxID=2779369 RepID=UPI0018E71192|nr:hypothetical protein [Alteromonas sp. IB21]MBJ2131123.1 hypothetical protein [Alteromonas sp. IB21]